jgi:hypothetical protein
MLVAIHCISQQSSELFSSAVPNDSRWEILQPKGDHGSLFKIILDKFEGRIFRLVKKDTGDFTWQKMVVADHPDDVKLEHKVNYQIFFSADGILLTFLLNVNTGATWRLEKDRTYGLWWSIIE